MGIHQLSHGKMRDGNVKETKLETHFWPFFPVYIMWHSLRGGAKYSLAVRDGVVRLSVQKKEHIFSMDNRKV